MSVKSKKIPKAHLLTDEYLKKACIEEGVDTMKGPFVLRVLKKFGKVGLLTINKSKKDALRITYEFELKNLILKSKPG